MWLLLQKRIRCWDKLISLWNSKALDTQKNYKIMQGGSRNAPLTACVVVSISLAGHWSRSKSRPRFDSGVSFFSLSPSLNFTLSVAADLMTCWHSPYWISHPTSAYTPTSLIYFLVKVISSSLAVCPRLPVSVCLHSCMFQNRIWSFYCHLLCSFMIDGFYWVLIVCGWLG